MAGQVETDKYYLEKEQIIEDSDSEFQYEEVPIDDDFIPPELEEDLELAVKTLEEAAQDEQAATQREVGPKASVTQRPEVVDDFVRNFLVRMGMSKTLDCFQTEWYELQQTGELREEDISIVPDIYIRNQQLDQQIKHLHREVTRFRDAAIKAKETYVKMRKERDFHRMHHKRVVQEKNKLITDIKRLKKHYSSYEPTLRELKQKYETAMKEKMLTKLERDRAIGQVQGLKNTLKSVEHHSSAGFDMYNGYSGPLIPQQRGSAVILVDTNGKGPTQRTLELERTKWEGTDVAQITEPRHPNDSAFPADDGINPDLAKVKGPCPHLTRSGGLRLTKSFQAHSLPVSGVALHPRKQILATTSDDGTWKMWALPSGEIIMTGEGHTDWVADCSFHPTGTRLATVSGDTTVKIWDFTKAECVQTFTDHTQAVWSCSWHSCGDFLATSSMDNTAKIWDLNSLRCRFTLRGHADSVNGVKFWPYSNMLVTCSADKTICLWDGRTGLCGQTFYGHVHSVNDVTFNMKGDTLATCDSYGIVKLWDIRTGTTRISIDCGPHPANKVAFDPAGSVLAIGSNDANIRMYEVETGKMSTLSGHEDAVQCLVFDRTGDMLVSGGSDLTARIWS